MRFLIGIFATIGLIILILVLLLRGGGSTPEVKTLKLANYAHSGSSAHYIVDGPIVADQNHETVQIDVDAEQVTLSVYKGYEGDVIKRQTYPNNLDAYTIFLKALQTQGFTIGNTDPALKDERGVCPLGERRIYSFDDGTRQVLRTWSSSCGSGTYKGKLGGVRTLFQSQVPDYSTQLRDTDVDQF